MSNYKYDDRDEGFVIESDEDMTICLVMKSVETQKSKVGRDGKLVLLIGDEFNTVVEFKGVLKIYLIE